MKYFVLLFVLLMSGNQFFSQEFPVFRNFFIDDNEYYDIDKSDFVEGEISINYTRDSIKVFSKYFQSGVIQMRSEMGFFEKDVTLRVYDNNPETEVEVVIKSRTDIEHGRHTEYYDVTGDLRSEGDLFRGEEVGIWKLYEEDGSLITCDFSAGDSIRPYVEYYSYEANQINIEGDYKLVYESQFVEDLDTKEIIMFEYLTWEKKGIWRNYNRDGVLISEVEY